MILKHVTLIHSGRAMAAVGLAGLACVAAAGVIAWSMLPDSTASPPAHDAR